MRTQTKLKDPQQINFIEKLDQDNGATMFFKIEKLEETTFNFLQNSGTKFCQIMEKQKIINLLNGSDNENSKFATKNGTLLIMKQMVTIHTTIQ